jgi:hypothetical protein
MFSLTHLMFACGGTFHVQKELAWRGLCVHGKWPVSCLCSELWNPTMIAGSSASETGQSRSRETITHLTNIQNQNFHQFKKIKIFTTIPSAHVLGTFSWQSGMCPYVFRASSYLRLIILLIPPQSIYDDCQIKINRPS